MSRLTSLVAPLNALLHGHASPTSADAAGGSGGPGSKTISLQIGGLVTWAIILGVIYGFFMGWFALFGGREGAWKHLLAVMVKVPALFFCTLVVTFPSLYVLSALLGSRIGFRATLQVLCATIAVNLVVAASLGPILGFFTLSTTSYGFMVLLNVLLMGIAGFISVGYLLRALRRARLTEPSPLLEVPVPPISEPLPPTPPTYPSSTPPHPLQRIAEQRQAGTQSYPQPSEPIPFIFLVWIVTYGVVGAQMGWILRPFIGSPNQPFELFRDRSGSVLHGVFNAIRSLF